MPSMKLLSAFLFVCLIVSVVKSYPTGKSDMCRSSSECSNSECCLIGFQRYSMPSCQPRGVLGDWCFERPEPQNRTLFFPNNQPLTFTDTFHLFCPCSDGLVCVNNVCSKDVQNFEMSNHI
ncbi:Astakine [Halotydeus destructor]|nr:Astakine [Halotydeus destructor]